MHDTDPCCARCLTSADDDPRLEEWEVTDDGNTCPRCLTAEDLQRIAATA